MWGSTWRPTSSFVLLFSCSFSSLFPPPEQEWPCSLLRSLKGANEVDLCVCVCDEKRERNGLIWLHVEKGWGGCHRKLHPPWREEVKYRARIMMSLAANGKCGLGDPSAVPLHPHALFCWYCKTCFSFPHLAQSPGPYPLTLDPWASPGAIYM